MAVQISEFTNFTILSSIFELMDDSSDDDSDRIVGEDDFPIVAAAAHAYRRVYVPKIEQFYENVVSNFTDQDFEYHFRLSHRTFHLLLQKYAHLIEGDVLYRGGYEVIPAEKRLAVFIWYIANQSSMRQVAIKFGLSKGTVQKVVHHVAEVLSENCDQIIQWPNAERRRSISEGFGNDLPGIIGIVDGTHIEIVNPTKDGSYVNRKGYASVQLQAICDDMLLINDIFIGMPGSAHDARVWRLSDISTKVQNGEATNENEIILADSAYPCTSIVIPPYKDNGRLTRAQKKFNRILSSKRQCVERCYGLLKGRMRKLKEIPFTDKAVNRKRLMKRIVQFIVSGAVVHNCCILSHDNLEDFIDLRAARHGDMGREHDGRGHVQRDYDKRQELVQLLQHQH